MTNQDSTDDKRDYVEDVKDLKDQVQHLEHGIAVTDGEVPYPEALKNMPEAPTMEMLQDGYRLVKSDSALKSESLSAYYMRAARGSLRVSR
jgi:hypothetical protein